MKNNTIIKIAAVGFIGLVVVPCTIGTTINLVGATAIGVGNMIKKVKFNKKIKQGLKDGSIIEIDGQYYEVEVNDVKEA